MAFNLDNFYPDPRAGGMRLHTYTTTDTIADTNTAGYFNSISSILQVNDIIFVASSTGGTPVVTITYVNANSAGVVDVVDGVVVTNTDSD